MTHIASRPALVDTFSSCLRLHRCSGVCNSMNEFPLRLLLVASCRPAKERERREKEGWGWGTLRSLAVLEIGLVAVVTSANSAAGCYTQLEAIYKISSETHQAYLSTLKC